MTGSTSASCQTARKEPLGGGRAVRTGKLLTHARPSPAGSAGQPSCVNGEWTQATVDELMSLTRSPDVRRSPRPLRRRRPVSLSAPAADSPLPLRPAGARSPHRAALRAAPRSGAMLEGPTVH